MSASGAGPSNRSASQSGLRTAGSGSRAPNARRAATVMDVREGWPGPKPVDWTDEAITDRVYALRDRSIGGTNEKFPNPHSRGDTSFFRRKPASPDARYFRSIAPESHPA